MAQLNPSWFAAVMGTAGTATVAALNPASQPTTELASRVLAIALLTISVVMFAYLAIRLLLSPPKRADITSAANGPAYATVPGSILVMALAFRALVPDLITHPIGWWVIAVATLIAAFMSFTLTVVFFVAAFEEEDFEAKHISGIWFVPETALLLSGLMCSELSEAGRIEWSVSLTVIALIFTGAGVVLFGFTAALFINRLVLHAQRLESGAAAMWIMISPLAVASLALHFISDDAQFLSSATSAGVIGTAEFAAAILWGFSLWWIAAAGLLTWHVRTDALTHSPADWGYVFPPAALTIATITFGRYWHSGLVEALGFLFSLILLVIWASVAWSALLRRQVPAT